MKWNEQLKQERQSRQWTQLMLAERVGTAKHTIMRWENGQAFPRAYYREQLITLLGINFETDDFPQNIVDLDQTISELASLPSEAEAEPEPVLHQRTSSQPLLTPAVQPQLVTPLVQDGQAHEQQEPWAADQLFPSDFLLKMNPLPTSGPFHRFSRHPILIGSILLLIILLSSAILFQTFIRQTSSGQTNYGFFSSIVTRSHVGLSPRALLGTTYEAQAPENTLAHGAVVDSCAPCLGGQKVRYIGDPGTLQFNNVRKNSAGNYTLTIYYINGDSPGSSRTMDVTVNGGSTIPLRMPGTGSWEVVAKLSLIVYLNAGNNTILFSNPQAPCPDIDRIVV